MQAIDADHQNVLDAWTVVVGDRRRGRRQNERRRERGRDAALTCKRGSHQFFSLDATRKGRARSLSRLLVVSLARRRLYGQRGAA